MKYVVPFLLGFFLMTILSSQGHARFYDPGVGDPHKNASVDFMYNIRKPVVKVTVPKEPAITYRVRQKRMYEFSRQARSYPLPDDPVYTAGRGQEVAQRYAAFFDAVAQNKLFAKADLKLNKIKKVPRDPNFLAAERAENRTLALFNIYDSNYRAAHAALWRLARDPKSPILQQSKDAVFAGIAAMMKERERIAMMAFEYAIDKNLGKIVEDKKRKNRQDENLQYLATLLTHAALLKDSSSLDKLVSKVDSRLLVRLPIRPELDPVVFSLAKQKYATSEGVIERLQQRLSENSAVTEKMELLEALGHIDSRKHKKALRMLKKLADSENQEISQNARINLARLLAMFSQYSQALLFYRSLPMEDLTRVNTLMEIAWLEFENQQFDFSLGKSIGLQSKFFAHAFIPEVYMLEAYSRKSVCDFGGAEKAIQAFKKDYSQEIESLRRLVRAKQKDKNFSMFASLKDSFSHDKEGKMLRYERYLLQVPAIASRQNELFAIQQEYRTYRDEVLAEAVTEDEQYMKDRKFLLDTFHDYYVKTKSAYLPVMESEIYEELKYMDSKLIGLFQQVEYLSLDIAASADINQSLQSALNYPVLPEKEEEDMPVTINRWAFADNEFWEDEIGWLRVTNPSKCVPKSNEETIDNSLAGL